MRVLYLRPYSGEIDIVAQQLPSHISLTTAQSILEVDTTVRSEIDVVSVFVDYPLSATELQRLPNLKMIAARSAGYDHIDVTYASSHNILISRVPHYGTRTVAEFAVALMFALSRHAFRAYTDMLQRTSLDSVECYEGFDLAGKTLGVIGTGAIGRSVCQIATGIGMKVLAYDVTPDETFADTAGVMYCSLEEALARSDIVTLHVPSTPSTHHLINANRIAQMKPGSYLINTARGDIVDTKALVTALRSGHLAGAGLDVLEGEHALREEAMLLVQNAVDQELWETLVADHCLIDMENVIVTPHIAFNTREAKREITEVTIQNILAYDASAPINVVNI